MRPIYTCLPDTMKALRSRRSERHHGPLLRQRLIFLEASQAHLALPVTEITAQTTLVTAFSVHSLPMLSSPDF